MLNKQVEYSIVSFRCLEEESFVDSKVAFVRTLKPWTAVIWQGENSTPDMRMSVQLVTWSSHVRKIILLVMPEGRLIEKWKWWEEQMGWGGRRPGKIYLRYWSTYKDHRPLGPMSVQGERDEHQCQGGLFPPPRKRTTPSPRVRTLSSSSSRSSSVKSSPTRNESCSPIKVS